MARNITQRFVLRRFQEDQTDAWAIRAIADSLRSGPVERTAPALNRQAGNLAHTQQGSHISRGNLMSTTVRV